MYIVFGWGDNPTGDQLKYRVSSYDFNVNNEDGDSRPANCVPGTLTLDIEEMAVANPAKDFLDFASKQHASAADEGAGKMVMYRGEGVGEAILEIAFKKGWITSLRMHNRRGDNTVPFTIIISAAEVTVSGVQFAHSGRREAVAA